MKKSILVLMVAWMFMSNIGVADEFSWHGFISQGVTQSVDTEFVTDNDEVSLALTEAGINGRYSLKPNLNVVGQVVYLNGGNRYREGARVDYLFVDWGLPEFNDWHVNLHIGRYKNRHWLSSATRDVPQTRSTAVLPQSIYYDAIRDVALSSDGLDIQASRYSDAGNWEVNVSYGRSPIPKSETKALVGPMAQGRVHQDYVHQMSVFWQPPSLKWLVGVSYLDSTFTYKPAEIDGLLYGDNSVKRYMLSLRYMAEKWELSSELIQEDFSYQGQFANGVVFSSDRIGQGGYVQWRYFIKPELALLLRYDTHDNDKNDRHGYQLQASSYDTIPRYYGFMDMGTVGLSWQFASNWKVYGEYSRTHGAGRLKQVLTPDSLVQAEEYWHMWSVQVMYWF